MVRDVPIRIESPPVQVGFPRLPCARTLPIPGAARRSTFIQYLVPVDGGGVVKDDSFVGHLVLRGKSFLTRHCWDVRARRDPPDFTNATTAPSESVSGILTLSRGQARALVIVSRVVPLSCELASRFWHPGEAPSLRALPALDRHHRDTLSSVLPKEHKRS